MKRRILGVSLVFLILLVSSAFLFPNQKELQDKHESEDASNDIEQQPVTAYVSYSNLYISGDSDFDTQASQRGWPGNGLTESTPYIIQNYAISSSMPYTKIHIQDTTRYFVIRGCYLYDGSRRYEGIYLNNVANGIIEDCVITACRHGIYLYNCEHMQIRNNDFQANLESGIRVYSTKDPDYWNDHVITGNSIRNTVYNGIWLETVYEAYIAFNYIGTNTGNGIFVDGRLGVPFEGRSGGHIIHHNNISGCENGIMIYADGIQYHDPYHEADCYQTFSNRIYDNFDGIRVNGYYAYTGDLYDNEIFDNSNCGIHCSEDSSLGHVGNNEIYANGNYGILVESGGVSYIFGNTISNHSLDGISVRLRYHGTISDNLISGNNGSGVSVQSGSVRVDIESNTFFDNTIAISLNESRSGLISQNTIYQNDNAINLVGLTHHYNLTHNNIFGTDTSDSNVYGIHIASESHDNIIHNNTICGCTFQGIILDTLTNSNLIIHNAFIHNNLAGSSQGYDNGTYNNVTMNYWWEWIYPDENNDGFVDIPYSIAGDTGNADPLPLAFPINPVDYHYLSYVTLLSPNGGEVVNGSVVINWIASVDSFGHSVNYSLSYSPDAGETWYLIVNDLQATQFNWDTSTIPEGISYLVRVKAYCNESLVVEDESDDTFTIQGHSLTTPFIIAPNGGEIIDGMFLISWTTSIDSWEHEVNYTISYSYDGGSTWYEIASDFEGTFISWDTTELPEGTLYLIKITAYCESGLYTEDFSDDYFEIRKHTISAPNIQFPNYGTIVRGICNITWSESIDSYEHQVVYSISFSNDGGASWLSIASGIEDTFYLWDTTGLILSVDCYLKINASCSEGISTASISESFHINNQETTSSVTETISTSVIQSSESSTTQTTTSSMTTSEPTSSTSSQTNAGDGEFLTAIIIAIIGFGICIVIIIIFLAKRRGLF